MQVSVLLLRWRSYCWAHNLWVLIISLFFRPMMLPSVLPRLATDLTVRVFPGVWKLLPFYQETPGVTGKFGLGIWNEAGQRLIDFCQENALVIANTLIQQHKRRLYTWTSPDGQHQNQIDYILCSQT